MASTAVLSADFLETFPEEVEYMWSTALSVPKILFFLLRYLSFAHTAISVIYQTGQPGNGGKECIPPFLQAVFSTVTINTLCEAISYVRVYGFAGRNPILLAVLSVVFISTTVLQYYFLATFAKTIRFAEIPASARLGCVPIAGKNLLLSIVFKLVLANLVFVTIIMVYVAYDRRDGTYGVGGLMRLFYRDGIFYFIVLSALAITNIIFDHTAPPNGLQFTMIQIQLHLNSALTGRMLLHLRAWAQKDRMKTYQMSGRAETSMLGELEFSGANSKASWRMPTSVVQIEVNQNRSVMR